MPIHTHHTSTCIQFSGIALVIFFIFLIFDWRIIALEYCHRHTPCKSATSPRGSPPSCTSPTPITAPSAGESQGTRPSPLCPGSPFPLAGCFTHGSVYVSVLPSRFIPPSPSPTVSEVCSLCLCLSSCPANQFIGSTFRKIFGISVDLQRTSVTEGTTYRVRDTHEGRTSSSSRSSKGSWGPNGSNPAGCGCVRVQIMRVHM